MRRLGWQQRGALGVRSLSTVAAGANWPTSRASAGAVFSPDIAGLPSMSAQHVALCPSPAAPAPRVPPPPPPPSPPTPHTHAAGLPALLHPPVFRQRAPRCRGPCGPQPQACRTAAHPSWTPAGGDGSQRDSPDWGAWQPAGTLLGPGHARSRENLQSPHPPHPPHAFTHAPQPYRHSMRVVHEPSATPRP